MRFLAQDVNIQLDVYTHFFVYLRPALPRWVKKTDFAADKE